MKLSWKNFSCYLSILILSFIFLNCSKDDSKEKNPENLSIMFPLEGGMQNIQLPANETVNYILTFQVPAEIKMVESVTIDVKASLKNASVAFAKSANKAALIGALLRNDVTGNLFVKVGDTPEAACASAITYGPYNLSAGFFGTPDPEEIELDQPSVQIVNRGTVSLCMQMLSSVDAIVSIGEVAVDVTQTECDEIADFSGTWEGTYKCDNSCGGEFGGYILLTVTQNGTNASYKDDEQYVYSGTVCGDVFRFKRTDNNETESGTLTLIDANTAVKRSTWRALNQSGCWGNCVDSLYRVAN